MYLEKIESASDLQLEKIAEVLNDYYLVYLSRTLSTLGRKEVHNGRAHFGIFGDGKELVQVVMAKFFRKGDWRSGYYRDQTLMMALGILKPDEFFAMIYGDTDDTINPSTGGRNFNNHFCTQNITAEGKIENLSNQYNSAADVSSTSGQMPRLLGLGQASKIARNRKDLLPYLNNNLSGDEVVFGTIGDASTSEGNFFETINAAGVMQIPIAVSVYDDGFGISVPNELQTTKGSISAALKGFEKTKNSNGIKIFKCKGWDYPALMETYKKGIEISRNEQIPVLFHIDEVTQPQGHSTSGSHERYKSKERLEWEQEFDPIKKFRDYILENDLADSETLDELEQKAKKDAKDAKSKAWKNYLNGYNEERDAVVKIINDLKSQSNGALDYSEELDQVLSRIFPTRRAYLSLAKRIYFEITLKHDYKLIRSELKTWIDAFEHRSFNSYNRQLYRENDDDFTKVKAIAPIIEEDAEWVNGSEIINKNFDKLFEKYPTLVTFGEDTGKLGGVNQGMRGMQEKYGIDRVSDTGIRESTIIGQGVGLALRGFRPIAEIQYLDYIYYGLANMTDDIATMQYRTKGKQAAPVIVRTRGHQLQGIWHAGSPMSALLGSLRGMFLCVPRNMTQASGMYNTLLELNDPALVIEPLKGYNVKEPLAKNIGEYKIELGLPEIITEGNDITIVTYGWNVHHAEKTANFAAEYGISVEVIDVQTLLPFDRTHIILESIKKTNKVIFLDEDVPGGASAYMMQKVMEEQKAFDYLDAPPKTISGMEHRPAYGIDGEFFSKPHVESIFEQIYAMMRETNVKKYPPLY